MLLPVNASYATVKFQLTRLNSQPKYTIVTPLEHISTVLPSSVITTIKLYLHSAIVSKNIRGKQLFHF